jgi:hypothetical protein
MIDWQKAVIGPNIRVFGEPAQYLPVVGLPFSLSVIFDDAFKVVTMSRDGTEVLSTFPAVGVNLADLPRDPAQGDKLRVRGGTFLVREPRPDSHGGAMLILNRVTY